MNNPLIVDNTILNAGRTCWRKMWYFKEQGLRFPTISSPLNAGAVIHAAIAAYSNGMSKEESMAVGVKAWQDTTPREGEWRTLDRVIDLLDRYFAQEQLVPVKAPNGEAIVEKDFALPILTVTDPERITEKLEQCGFDGLLYAGILDGIYVYAGSNFVGDHKTTTDLRGDKRKGESKYINLGWWDGFKPHGAVPGYIWAARQYIGDASISGAIINGLGWDSYGNTTFGRQTYEWTPEEIEEWRQDTLTTIEMYLDCKIRGYWPKNPDSCLDYNTKCPYWQMCKLPASQRDALLTNYVVDKWDPLDARKKEAARS